MLPKDQLCSGISIRGVQQGQVYTGWPRLSPHFRLLVAWAIDAEKRMPNLGPVSLSGNHAKGKFQVPFRVLGLLVTTEKNPQA